MRYILLPFILFYFSLNASTLKTPADVYTQAYLLKQKIIFIRDRAKIKGDFPEVEKQKNKEPRHVLQKSLEVLSKVNKYRIAHNYGQIAMPQYPSREITPSDVYVYVKRLNEEVTPFIKDIKILNSLKARTFKNKTPSDVYTLLWSVSLAMDPLLGMRGFTPTDVYEQSQTIVNIAKFLRQSQGDFSKIKKPEVKKDLHPNHALNTSYQLLAKIAKIEKKLWMKQTEVPPKIYRVTTPTHVYDSLQNIIAEMQRLKTRLGIERYFETKVTSSDKTPSDVVTNLLYAKALLPEFNPSNPLKQYDKQTLKKTPNEGYGLSEDILNKLSIIAKYKGINLHVKKPPYIYNLSPGHVYQKGIESIEKAIKFKTSEGFYKSNIPSQPFEYVTPSEVYELVDRLNTTITLILQKNYDKKIKQYKYIPSKKTFTNKTSSDVYHNLWKISNTLDSLSGSEYTPNETYILAMEIEKNIDIILNNFEIVDSNSSNTMLISTNKSPKDVFNESLKLHNTLSKIRKRANINTLYIEIPREEIISPNTVYNALRIITAQINSFKIKYNIENKDLINKEIELNKTPNDVYKLVKSSNIKLRRLFENESY